MNDVTESPLFQFEKFKMTSQKGEIVKNNASVTWH